jgi:orotidine-5'-phosphate decarboxylase
MQDNTAIAITRSERGYQMSFMSRLKKRLATIDSHLCVGLDSDYSRIPYFIKDSRTVGEAIFEFNKLIIEETADWAVAYKCNVSFYACHGVDGLSALALTNKFLAEIAPSVPRLADCKRSEMGESVKLVGDEIFGWLGFDCVMVTPWFGFDTIRGYLSDDDHGVVVYAHDSNPSAGEIQDLMLADGRRVYEVVAEKAAGEWNHNGNVWVEAGVTYPEALRRIRGIVGDEMPILVAGIGPQGGKPAALRGFFGRDGRRLLANSSRGIIFASSGANEHDYRRDVRMAAKNLVEQLQSVRDMSCGQIAEDLGALIVGESN